MASTDRQGSETGHPDGVRLPRDEPPGRAEAASIYYDDATQQQTATILNLILQVYQ